MHPSEFCQSRGLSFSTLDRHLKKRRWKRLERSVKVVLRQQPHSFLLADHPAFWSMKPKMKS